MGLREVQAFLQQPADVERVPLVPAGRHYVKFSGPRGGEGPVTLGQLITLTWVHDTTQYNRMTESVLHVPAGATLDDIAAAFGVLLARHESLRTTFGSIDGRGVQEIHEPNEVHIPLVDLSALPAPERDAALRRELEAEAATPFDLSRGPLLRARLVRLAPDEHVLTLMLHHIVTDGWSIGVIMDDLSALYAAAVRAEDTDLPPLPLQYADYAAWQRQRLAGAALDEQLAYWRRQLDRVAPLELPTDRPR
ncbi:MAG TPA: condensation domain-containing protein, partial [Streptosporangiaceae bacterium]